MKRLYLLLISVSLAGAGCVNSSKPVVEVDQEVADCRVSIDISAVSENTSDYDKATFSYPCDWKNDSTATMMKLLVPNTNMIVTYPTTFEGDLPMDGVEKPLDIMGQAHVRYITREPEGAMGDITRELIRGPVVDVLGTRPYYQYPTGNAAGDQMAGVFASLELE